MPARIIEAKPWRSFSVREQRRPGGWVERVAALVPRPAEGAEQSVHQVCCHTVTLRP
jgi:hypothetical protein